MSLYINVINISNLFPILRNYKYQCRNINLVINKITFTFKITFKRALAIKDKSDVATASLVKAMCKQHVKMTRQAAVAHSSAKKGNK